jgi:NarL family two-component system sensor histidine kinase LiaS
MKKIFGTERQRISLRYLHFLNNRFNFLIKNLYWDNLELASLLGYYRYISLLITSALYLCGPPPSPFYLKAGVCFCLFLEAFLFIRFYNNEGGSTWGKKLFLFVETIGLAFVLTLTGGLDSPFLWYAINPILLAITLAPAYFCWALMGAFLFCSALLQQFNIYGPEAVYVFWPDRAYLVVIFVLSTLGGQLFNFFIVKLSRQKQIMEKQLQHIKSLYGAVEVFSHNSDPQEIVSLFASYSRALTGAKKVIVWIETEMGVSEPEKKNYFVVRGPRDVFPEESWYPYIKKEFEKKQHAPEVNMQSFPGVKGQKPGVLVTVRIKSSVSVFGVLSAFYLGKEEALDEVEQTLTFLADLCAVALEKRSQESLAEKLLLVEEKDRIAGEIHDNVTQNIFGLVYGLDMLIKKEDLGEAVVNQLRLLQKTAQRSLKDLRASIYCMSTRKNKKEPFLEDVRRYLTELGQLNDVSVEFDCRGSLGSIKSVTRNSLYRIIREATGNAVRHGNCSSIKVSLIEENGILELTIADNGRGFDPEEYQHGSKNGLGLLNMKELARSMGGNLSIESKPGKGTVVSCVVMAGMSDNFILNATGTAGKGEH